MVKPKKKSGDYLLRRSSPLFIRLSVSEKSLVRSSAHQAGLTMDEYTRCKLFDIPFEYVSGRVTKKSHKASEATKATA